MNPRYEPVIGLEVHCQLLTTEKLFCGCPATFGGAVNAHTCPVCLGLPGVLPVLNREAVDLALRAGLALGCTINDASVFARKHYFYPDLPKGYQITQYTRPVLEHGHLDVDVRVGGAALRIGITRIHLEEDAGKSVHTERGGTLVDLNRAGVPLIEIVSEPDLRSADTAVAYLRGLHEIVRTLGICDGNLEEGSFRCDANVSVRPRGQAAFGTRTEIKNMNTFKGVHRGSSHEIARHCAVLDDGGEVAQETRLWDDAAGRTRSMRGKEDAHDYRYFPEPDLPPVPVDAAWVERARAALPELPRARRARLLARYGLSEYDVGVLTAERGLADYFEAAVAAHDDAKTLCNWVTTELLARFPADAVAASPVSPVALARLVGLIADGTISGRIAKTVFEAMCAGEGEPDAIIEGRGLRQVTDEGAIEAVVREVVARNPEQFLQLRGGKTKVRGFLVGQIMKATRGQASPTLVNAALDRLLEEGPGEH